VRADSVVRQRLEEKGKDGDATSPMEQQICHVQRHELLAAAPKKDDTPAAEGRGEEMSR